MRFTSKPHDARVSSAPVQRALRLSVFAALVVAFASGCNSTVKRRDWSNYTGPGAEFLRQEELPFPQVDDPLEPVNRVVAFANYLGMKYLLRPAFALYRVVVPATVRTHLGKAATNLQYPARALNNVLQGKWKGARIETERFAVNTTVGVLGLFDPAAKWGLHPHPEDFGQTFASWGWKNSTYLYLPIVGPSTVRDSLGLIPDTYTDVSVFDWRISVARESNRRSDEIEPALRLIEANYDSYEPARVLYTLNREVDIEDFSWKRDESGATQTLDSIFLKPEDPEFPEDSLTRRVPLSREDPLPYSIWLHPKPAPLVYLVPGLGGHRLGDMSLGLAEIVYKSGSSVVALSNPTNWEFIAHGSSVDLPGYAPTDARDLHRAITAIDRQLEAEWPGRFTTRRLAGVSIGAFQALYIAANEARSREEGLLDFEVYLALNPPLNLEHAMTQIDRFYNAPLSYAAEERAQRIEEIFGKVLYLSNGDLQPEMELPFTRLESEFLIGLSFRLDLQYTILQTQDRHDSGVLRTPRTRLRRAPAFREASEYSYRDYFYAFVLPYYSKRDARLSFDDAGARQLFDDCDLRTVGDALAANERVRVFTNENDFLLRPEDLQWLRESLGDRARIFPAGGHLGNLHRKSIQQAIEIEIEDAAQSRSRPRSDRPKSEQAQ
jgi:ABC-type transporter lipoprotein component MlaA